MPQFRPIGPRPPRHNAHGAEVAFSLHGVTFEGMPSSKAGLTETVQLNLRPTRPSRKNDADPIQARREHRV